MAIQFLDVRKRKAHNQKKTVTSIEAMKNRPGCLGSIDRFFFGGL